MTDITSLLGQMRALLPALLDPASQPVAARQFEDAFFVLYKKTRDGLDGAEAADVAGFVSEAAATLEPALPYIAFHLGDRIESGLNTSFQADEWLQLCALRSSLEAMRDMFAAHVDVTTSMAPDEELDMAMSQKALTEAYQDPAVTPLNFPKSHWWWAMS